LLLAAWLAPPLPPAPPTPPPRQAAAGKRWDYTAESIFVPRKRTTDAKAMLEGAGYSKVCTSNRFSTRKRQIITTKIAQFCARSEQTSSREHT
jgi:hypothetical protein